MGVEENDREHREGTQAVDLGAVDENRARTGLNRHVGSLLRRFDERTEARVRPRLPGRRRIQRSRRRC